MTRLLPALLAVLTLATACGDSRATTDPDPAPTQAPGGLAAGTLDARLVSGTLILRNTTAQVVSYRLFEAETITRALFPVCTIESCPTLRQGEEARVPLTNVVGWHPQAREVIVPFWRMIPGRDGQLIPSLPGETARATL
ncbi:MAG: hypothetical protein MUF00_00430 [Gemmatimonadaceae bacterium]|jgi:hypothetical protein|nr:hypothetical protein [Gemmatimonadaceae bacterium]